MAKAIPEAVREICLSFPEASEIVSHGSPNFSVRGKSFALDLQARIGVGFYEEDENGNGEADIKGSNIGVGAALTWF